MLRVGTVVKAMAGRDKDKFFCIVERSQGSVLLADGKSRPLEKPKRKNERHVQATTTILDLELVGTNKKLKAALRPFREAEERQDQQEGGDRFCQKQM